MFRWEREPSYSGAATDEERQTKAAALTVAEPEVNGTSTCVMTGIALLPLLTPLWRRWRHQSEGTLKERIRV